jgi:hypothetical protein
MSIKWAIVFAWLGICATVKAEDGALLGYLRKNHPGIDWADHAPQIPKPREATVPPDNGRTPIHNVKLGKGVSTQQSVQNGPHFQSFGPVSQTSKVSAPKIIRGGSSKSSGSTRSSSSSRRSRR